MTAAAAPGGYLTAALADVPASLDWLSRREHETLAPLHVLARRQDWLLGRWAAKQAVRTYGATPGRQVPLCSIEIIAAPDGAPEVFVGTLPATCRISISHRAGRALCAVAPCAVAVGCDLERVEPRDQAMVEDFFRADEAALVGHRAGSARDLLVALIWSAKESALKLLRDGLRRDTRSVHVLLEPVLPAQDCWAPLTVRVEGRPDELRGWWRTASDDVLTVVTAPPSAPPYELAPLDGTVHEVDPQPRTACAPESR